MMGRNVGPKKALQQRNRLCGDQRWSEVSKTWRDDRSWRMDGISVLKCSPEVKAGVLLGA